MKRHPAIVAVLCSFALLLAGCQAPKKETGFPANIEEPEEEKAQGDGPVDLEGAIEVIDNDYTPKQARVSAGTTVRWEQTGTAPHSVTADDKSFDSHPDCLSEQKCMLRGDTFEYTFEKPGEYPYYCVIHGAPGGTLMAGTVIVE